MATRAFIGTYLGKLATRGLLDRVAGGRNILRTEVNCQYPDRRERVSVNHHGISTIDRFLRIRNECSPRPRLTRRQFRGTVVRTVGYIASALICSAFVHHVDHAWAFAIRVGLVTGIVTGVGLTGQSLHRILC